ncbi:hypothetical protein WN944_008923 [Citrus x changshan-huyou]|uniref:Uncharacterized protein n=1 Tax=Citrus x changshan-huyou TaxID=2935761 RepID=A0AAP0MNT5_9ROSI
MARSDSTQHDNWYEPRRTNKLETEFNERWRNKSTSDCEFSSLWDLD